MNRFSCVAWVALPNLRPLSLRDHVMLITICRLYDSYADASQVVLALEAAGVPPSEASLISNNSDAWYKAAKSENVIPLWKKGASSEIEGAAIGAAIGATAATAASLVTMLALPGVGAVVGAGWLAATLGSMAI